MNERFAVTECVHGISLTLPCPDCEGKAADAGFEGSGIRLVYAPSQRKAYGEDEE